MWRHMAAGFLYPRTYALQHEYLCVRAQLYGLSMGHRRQYTRGHPGIRSRTAAERRECTDYPLLSARPRPSNLYLRIPAHVAN